MDKIKEKMVELLICADDYEVAVCKEYPCRNCQYRGVDCTYKARANHLIANGVTIQKWIPVSERLPEPFEIVIVYDKNEKYVSEAYMTKHKEWVGIHMKSTVTHWMPLPEPPKGE